MKKKLLLLAVLVMLASLMGSSTLAYTTVEGEAVNVITSGGVEILLEETAEDGKPFPAEGIRGVVPGTSCTKIVNVTNIGGHEAWIRVRVDTAITLAGGRPGDAEFMRLDYNTTDWQERDGYFYYLHPLAPGETTKTPLFTCVSFAPEMGNPYQGSYAQVNVAAMATQAANNGSSVWDAKGWPEEPQE